MTTRVSSSRLIGRLAELAELEAALADAGDGRPSVAFVAGESGVGKTRMLAELIRRAREAGTLVLAGETVHFGDEGELPYLPLVAALRPLARVGDPALTDSLRAAVAPLLPGVDPETGADQGSVFEGLLALLAALGEERPVLLVIEDLHWADRSTRAALAFLARSLTDERALVVASYRPDELLRRHPLRALLAELERAPRARRITLGPLTRDELAEQLADILGASPAPELLERLWTRSGGNPLFGEELLAAGLDGRGAPPDTLRDALVLRVERLTAPARDVVGRIAVGQRLDHELLEDSSGLAPETLRGALREALDHHLLVVQDDGMYRFRHALLREVVENDLLPGERRELHESLARALERRLDAAAGAQIVAAVAYHFDAAGDRPSALAAAVRAAKAAERVYAHDEAVALLERALELWDRVPDAQALAGADRATVLVHAADAAGAVGDPGRQLALLEAAFADLGPQPDPRRAAGILESTARAQRHLNRATDSIATLERGLALVDRSGPLYRAGLLAGLARARMLVAHYIEAVRVAREALEDAAAGNLPLMEGHARNTLGFSLAMTGDVDTGAAELREAIRIAREHDNLFDLGEAYNNYAHMLHVLGRSDEARAVALEGREAVAGRRPVAVMWLDARLAEIAFDVGAWELSEATLPTPQRWTGTQARVGTALRRASLALARGDDASAAALVRELEPMSAGSTEPQVLASLGGIVTELRRRQGDVDAACAAVDHWLGRLAFCRDDACARPRAGRTADPPGARSPAGRRPLVRPGWGARGHGGARAHDLRRRRQPSPRVGRGRDPVAARRRAGPACAVRAHRGTHRGGSARPAAHRALARAARRQCGGRLPRRHRDLDVVPRLAVRAAGARLLAAARGTDVPADVGDDRRVHAGGQPPCRPARARPRARHRDDAAGHRHAAVLALGARRRVGTGRAGSLAAVRERHRVLVRLHHHRRHGGRAPRGLRPRHRAGQHVVSDRGLGGPQRAGDDRRRGLPARLRARRRARRRGRRCRVGRPNGRAP
jgi:tetratricopeptide (TPR) repeat protein